MSELDAHEPGTWRDAALHFRAENERLTGQLAAVTAERDALETVIADAVSVGEMEGQDFLLMPWSTLRAALAARGGEAAS